MAHAAKLVGAETERDRKKKRASARGADFDTHEIMRKNSEKKSLGVNERGSTD